ncbi:MAG TPA: hypothetical protein VMD98_00035 [Bryocella sp.]|nr:hypothetical protein [Bryocella sp.]
MTFPKSNRNILRSCIDQPLCWAWAKDLTKGEFPEKRVPERRTSDASKKEGCKEGRQEKEEITLREA